jgi:hypothetical protein
VVAAVAAGVSRTSSTTPAAKGADAGAKPVASTRVVDAGATKPVDAGAKATTTSSAKPGTSPTVAPTTGPKPTTTVVKPAASAKR